MSSYRPMPASRPRASRRVLSACLLLLLVTAPAVAHHEPLDEVGTRRELVPPTNGTFTVGLIGIGVGDRDGNGTGPAPGAAPVGAEPGRASWQRWKIDPPDCDRRVFVDLAFEPHSLTDTRDPPADLRYSLLAIVTQDDHQQRHRFTADGRAMYVTTVPEDAPFTFDLVLEVGIDVDWSLRVEGRQDFHASGCGPDPL